ncbi:CRISPR-associated endonuclease/helicase Cas3 [Caldalkalibacillus uzonensis]|uniref:CRISPR-associated endonuclease/helicase Cas3 n=1 Tax=Caldalkalibacillus uzonensis TaxID=353224 RepID=A0ABU0CWJ4_9BACI|nr:CRISPR-associated helicase Cas3' [Caldalkalibacillus uzonensis]MDQ0340793.1 CRISPR-associated endonuclease/helicase Cas3 [Caldalkalibacillus uzonensis]
MNVLYSHPDQSLQNHLAGVLKAVQQLWEQRQFTGWETTEEKRRLRDLLCVAAVFHDFAKATSYFQDYILSEDKKKTPLNRHSLLSAIVSYFIGKKNLEPQQHASYEPLFLFLAVKRHHGNMNNLFSEVNIPQEERHPLLEQAKAIDYAGWNDIVFHLASFLPETIKSLHPLTEEQVTQWVETFFEKDIRHWRRKIRRELKPQTVQTTQFYYKYCSLYSLLLDADKNQAAFQEKLRIERKDINSLCVDEYRAKQNWNLAGINRLREQAYREVKENLEQAPGRLFSINLPTGLGKTIISLKAALQLRERRKCERGIAPRIIYALPFLSVIDQNAKVFENVLRYQPFPVDPFMLMKHHSMVDPYEEMFGDAEYDFNENQARILMEGWQSELICTTFVQLFQTLISNRNRAMRKFHRLANAILVIDEIQAVPVKFWPLMREMLLELTRGMNTDVILLTATQPKLFEPADGLIELCHRQKYFNQMDRVRLFPNVSTKQTIEEFVEGLNLYPERSYLFILNTISSAKELFAELKTKFDEPIAFLSTHIPPKERLKRIREIKAGKYRIVVSTQLVEAGVDIDFDVIYRDLSPMESIVQSSGRCNRNGLRTGTVHIMHLWNGKKGSYAGLVYPKVAIEETKALLQQFEEIKEQELFPLIEKYYEIIKTKLSKSESIKYLNAVSTLYFSGEEDPERIPVSDFQLIEEEYPKIDIFIELDEEARRIWASFEEIIDMENSLQRYQQLARLKIKFQEYVVSVPAKVENRPPVVNDHFYVGYNSLADYYDPNTGFITEGVTAIW